MNPCRCGCGEDAGYWDRNYRRWGVMRGDPKKYINGHRTKKDPDAMYRVDTQTGCWVWTGNIESGYARLGQLLAYRLFFERAKGPMPSGLQIDHLCRNRACVNPDHLEAVTRAENMRRAPATRLTADIVRALRRRPDIHVRGVKTRLARELGVSRAALSAAAHGNHWKDIEVTA